MHGVPMVHDVRGAKAHEWLFSCLRALKRYELYIPQAVHCVKVHTICWVIVLGVSLDALRRGIDNLFDPGI